MAIHFFGC